MELNLIGNRQALLVEIGGELDHHVAAKVREAVDGRIKSSNARNIIFDFRNVTFMDSSGIGVIMGRYKLIKTLGGKVIIFGAGAQIKRIIVMSGVDQIVRLADTLDDALRRL